MNGVNTNRVVHSWNARDTIGYECPIKELVNRTTTQVIEERGERIYQAVLDIDVHVDKEELLKALQYDRGQYEKGYRDGVTDTNVGCKWIPCSEQMPPIDKKVLVTVDIQGDLAIDIADHSYGLWFFADEYYSYTEKDFKVLAWMPLPEPYREDGEQNG